MITVLPCNNVATMARAVPGFSGCTAVGEIYDEHHQARTVYVKAFPSPSRGLINEVVYWMCASYLELTVPSAAWVVLVEPRYLRALWPQVAWPDKPLPCWASQEISNSAPEAMPVTESPLLARELQEWPEVYQVIALHEWLANADGNIGNYLRLGPRRYASIDGAEIFGGQDWTGERLARIGYIHNKLAHIVGAINDHVAEEFASVAVLGQCVRHTAAVMSLEQELLRWLSVLCGPADAHLALDFLKNRIGLANTRWHKKASTLTL